MYFLLIYFLQVNYSGAGSSFSTFFSFQSNPILFGQHFKNNTVGQRAVHSR